MAVCCSEAAMGVVLVLGVERTLDWNTDVVVVQDGHPAPHLLWGS